MSDSSASKPGFPALWFRLSLVAYALLLLFGALDDGLGGLAIRAVYGLLLAPLFALLPAVVWVRTRG